MKATYLKPLLPLRDIVIFPSMVVPLFVGREKSIKALQEVMKNDKSIVLVTQKNSEIDDPSGRDLYQYGCLSKILQLLKLPDGTVKVLVEGEKRIKILKDTNDGFLISEEDMKLRGFGDILGFKQSGVKNFKLADPIQNSDLFLLAEKEMRRIEKSNEDISKFKTLIKLYDRADIINDIA